MYFFLVLGIFCIITALFTLSSKRAKEKNIKKIRDKWGKPNEEYINFDQLFPLDVLGLFSDFHIISDQTKNDISFNDLFCLLNRTISKVGEQYFYNLLLHPTNNIKEIHSLNKEMHFFIANSKQREDCQIVLSKLKQTSSYNIAILLMENNWLPPHWYNYAKWLTILICLTTFVSFFIPSAVVLLIFLFAINLFFHLFNKQKSEVILKGLQQVGNLIIVSESLQKTDIQFKDERIDKITKSLNRFKKQNSFINFQVPKEDTFGQLFFLIVELTKSFFLIDVHLTQINIKSFFKHKSDIITLFGFVGKIDAAISVASLFSSNKDVCLPTFVSNKSSFEAVDLYHPLFKNCIPNTFKLQSKSMFITGSNMSGKSTFLRTVIINSILAQTIGICFAKSFATPMLRQFSSIKIEDHLLQGKSYFLEEVAVMKNLLDESRNAAPGLFVIDEVFKGTNTVERIAAAKAVLNYLINQSQNFVLVSSHDLELLGLLNEVYLQYHFSENLINGQFIYDHKLKPGHVETTNAIRILEMYGYPTSIINEANQSKL